jgi:hypothetical protein
VDTVSEVPESLPQRRTAMGPPTGGLAGQLPRRPSAEPAAADGPTGQLPRRPARVQPRGRHRSPHRLTVPTDAPPLVLAVPGRRHPAVDGLAADIANTVSVSCPNATIRISYLDGEADGLAALLSSHNPGDAPQVQPAVVIPLLAGPHPQFDAELAQAVAGATMPVIVTDHLGPHPLIAEAMHARLSEAGLARASRVRGLSITNAADGVIVLADRGQDAEHAAGVIAVLLASRLAIPAAPASIGDRASLEAAITRLHGAQATVLAVAPCVIGPESDPAEIDALCAAIGSQRCQPLAAHPAISQLIAMRYGVALADRRLAV